MLFRVIFGAVLTVFFTSPTFGATRDSAILSPVVITEDAPPRKAASTPSEFTGTSLVVDSRGESSLIRTLSRRAGVYVQKAGGDDSQASIQLRGQDPTQSRFFVEGIPLTDAQFHTASIGWFPAESVYSMDLFPEGTPAILGSDGLGGAVSLRLTPAGSGPSFLGTRLGAFGARRVFGKASVNRPAPVSVFLDATASTEDFLYRDSSGTPFFPGDDRMVRRDHNGQSAFTLLPQWRVWQRGASYTDLFSFHTLRQTQIPGAVGLPLRGQLNQTFHLVAAHTFFALPRGQSLEGVIYGWNQDQAFQASEDLTALQTKASLSRSFGTRWTWHSEGPLSTDVSAGLSGDLAQLQAGDGRQTHAQRVTVPVAFSGRWDLSKSLQIKPAVLTQFSFFSNQRRTNLFSPRLALEWETTALQKFRLLGGHYQRVPSLSELYGSPAAVSPNPSLKEERAWKAEVGWDGRWPLKHALWRDIQVSATLSASLADDLIVLVPNSQSSFIAQNIGRSQIVSPEIAAEIGLGRDWSVRSQLAWLATQNLSKVAAYQGKELPMRPSYRMGAEVEWANGPWRLTYSLQASGAFHADPANTRRIGAYGEHGLWGSWKSARWGTWMLELRNITDALTVAGQEWGFSLDQNTTGIAGFPAPGRRVYFTWRYEI